MALDELPEVKAMLISEKLELVDAIWKSVARELSDMTVSEDEKNLLNERWNRFLATPDSALDPDEFMERLRALRACETFGFSRKFFRTWPMPPHGLIARGIPVWANASSRYSKNRCNACAQRVTPIALFFEVSDKPSFILKTAVGVVTKRRFGL